MYYKWIEVVGKEKNSFIGYKRDAGAGNAAVHTTQNTQTHTHAVYTVKSNRHPVNVEKCLCAEVNSNEQSGNNGMCR